MDGMEPTRRLPLRLFCMVLISSRMAAQSGNHLARPSGDALTFGGEPMEALTASAKEDRDAELELLDAAGKTGLRDIAALGRPSEVLLLNDSHQILELA
jgi:hypothetical protein